MPELRDFILPPLFIVIFIGYQISIYFFYRYYELRNEKIAYNKILIAFGCLYGISLTGIFIRIINHYYLKDNSLFDFFTRLSFLFLIFALIAYFIIISGHPFENIVNTNISKFFMFYNIIPLISVFFLRPESIQFVIILLLTIPASCAYIFLFFYKLVKVSTGAVKKRLLMIMLGAFIAVLSMIFEGFILNNVLLQQFTEILQILSVPCFLIGLTIVFLGIFKFPAFLELEWRENLLNLFIIDQGNFQILYSYDFYKHFEENKKVGQEHSEKIERGILFSRGISGIEDIVSTITRHDEEKIYKIKHGDDFIFLKYGNDNLLFITYGLLVSKDMNSFNYFLNKVKNQFENYYKNILLNLNSIKGNEDKIFSSFDNVLKEILD